MPLHVLPIWLNGNINANCSWLRKAHKYPPTHIQDTQTHTHPQCAQYMICQGVKNCSAGILPNIMEVRGYTCTYCMSTSLVVLWVGANRKHIDEWCCSILRSAVALQRLLKCFSRLFCCKTSTERAWNDWAQISERHIKANCDLVQNKSKCKMCGQ